MIMREGDHGGSASARVDDAYLQMETRQIYCGGQPGGTGADHQTVQRIGHLTNHISTALSRPPEQAMDDPFHRENNTHSASCLSLNATSSAMS